MCEAVLEDVSGAPARVDHTQCQAHGDALWERHPDRCCGLRKVQPLRRYLAGRKAWITGIRRDQASTRAQARVVECRFFAGMSVEETAEALDISPATVKRDWTLARAFLNRELGEG